MALLGYDLDEIARILQMMDDSGLDELIIEENDRSLKLRRPRRQKPMFHTTSAPAAQSDNILALPPAPKTPQKSAVSPGGMQTEPAAGQIALASPMMGIFYRSEKPDSPSFVTIGQHISVGQTIGIIEAMKVFSEVLAEHSGIAVAVPAQDGQLVQAGFALVILQQE